MSPHLATNDSDRSRAPRLYFRWRLRTVYVPARYAHDPELASDWMAEFLAAQVGDP